MTESVGAAALVTCLEVVGIVIIIALAGSALGELPARLPEMLPGFRSATWFGIAAGAFLAFFAFIGFEDIVNMAEETRERPPQCPPAPFSSPSASPPSST